VNTALNPAVTPLLAYVVIALLVVFSFVAAVLVTLSRVKRWLKELFLEFVHSPEFEQVGERVLTRIAEKMNAPLASRMDAVEARDVARAEAVTRAYRRIDHLNERIDRLHQEAIDLYKRLPAKEAAP
jgi:hypothetical protein